MKDNIFALAKLIAESDPESRKSLWKAVMDAGYTGAPQQLVREISATLLAVWDGKASTLDQAAAWREVWKHLTDGGKVVRLTETGETSDLQIALDTIDALRGVANMAATTSINIDLDKWDPAALDRLLKDLREYPKECVSGTLRRGQALRGSAMVWPTPREQGLEVGITLLNEDYSSLEAKVLGGLTCPCHAASPKAPKAIGKMIDKRGKGKDESYEIQSIIGETEDKWVVVDMDGTIRHPHSKAWDLDLYFGGCPISLTGDPVDSAFHPVEAMKEARSLLVPRKYIGVIPLTHRQECLGGWVVIPEWAKGDPDKAFFASAVEYRMEYPSNDNDLKWVGREFGKNCTVYLKSGGPAMKVVDVHEFADALKYQCVWLDAPEECVDWFRPTSLSRTPFVDPANDNTPLENTRASENLGDVSYETSLALEKLATVVEPARLDVMRRLLVLQDTCYGLAERAGWWKDLETGEDVREWPKVHLNNWISAKLMLTVTEVAEAMEGHRKGLTDDKLPHRRMLEVELADAVIRIMDLAGGMNLDVAGAIVEKLAYNMTREDHQIENRKAAGGKSI